MTSSTTATKTDAAPKGRRRITPFRVAIASSAVLGLAAAAVLLAPSSGANFSASDTGDVEVNTATLSLDLSDAGHAGTFDLTYDNVKPGDSVVKTFTVKNTGSIKADVTLGAPFSNMVVPALPASELVKLKAGVDNYAAPVSVTSLSGDFALGQLNAGQQRTYSVRIALGSDAGNVWQARTVGATATVTLDQAS